MIQKSLLAIIIFCCTVVSSFAQSDTIYLNNPSFEDTPKRGGDGSGPIKDWFDCGAINFPLETPPDIHPNGFWENNLPASDKKTYLGMVVRDNGTYEAVSTRLVGELKANQCYKFSIHLARASSYVSHSRISMAVANYTTPAVLRVWGGNGYCNEAELLAESTPINNTSWQIFTFKIRPKTNIRSITLSAYYKTPVQFPYNGNILVDGASAFVSIPCPGDTPENDIVKSNIPPHKQRNNRKAAGQQKGTMDTTTKSSDTFKPKVLHELDKNKVKEGQIIEIRSLQFKADSSKIESSSYAVLDDIYGFLMSSDKVIVEIGGHTNSIPSISYCDELSTARAKAVAEYLINKGVDPSKIQFKGYGKRQPIADNRTATGRAKNQRVELKILSWK
ncbi:MAG: outer membrane protein [Bacteroidetes bacterium OLB9]|nr:MAG: outer membrane protein [Bacteroidetes bacterium OLB9]